MPRVLWRVPAGESAVNQFESEGASYLYVFIDKNITGTAGQLFASAAGCHCSVSAATTDIIAGILRTPQVPFCVAALPVRKLETLRYNFSGSVLCSAV